MHRRMARAKKKVDLFEFRGSDDESDDEDKLSAKRKRRNLGNSTPHSVNGLDDGGGSPCRDEDGGRSTCRAKLCFPGSDNRQKTTNHYCRMATPARAKSASTAMYAWRDAIFKTTWNEDDELGTLRRQIWQDHFDWTPEGEDFERPFRFPPSLPSSRGASVCECVFARDFVCVSLSQCLLSLSDSERASERAIACERKKTRVKKKIYY
jgi:hypothetical protein